VDFLGEVILKGLGEEEVDYLIKNDKNVTKIVERENYFNKEKEPFFLRLFKNL
jgi:hypothetical protein